MKQVYVVFEGRELSLKCFAEEYLKSDLGKELSDEDKAIVRRFWELVDYPNN